MRKGNSTKPIKTSETSFLNSSPLLPSINTDTRAAALKIHNKKYQRFQKKETYKSTLEVLQVFTH
ncbi:hypothetical protein AKJ40_03405 [candidate division MSBL1 archaeon SCGC-AAA259M10]|uniref:Uncharacterized protein n=1 Tax=candidate division MSBL1 archaeon SCGC-AAA259M10 TaxID=1698270 RepID=A0A133UYN8_9EURY|nr:hypothetical protein AKJ40_03405 [candidate division MSBL1 archaeon SCGC-AAA259M10]